jgi:flagella basal body P-ring formation protein FlgA
VRRGEAVAASQVVVLDGEWTNVPGTPVLAAPELAGLIATRELAAGTVLVRESFELPLLVDRGGAVRMVLRDGGLQIVATGVAQKAGRRGDTIPVMNPSTQKLLQAQLVEKRPSGEVVAFVR